MKYQNYNNARYYFLIGLLVFILFGGLRLVFLLIPIIFALFFNLLPLLLVFYILRRIIPTIRHNHRLNLHLHRSTKEHSRFVELLIQILIHIVKADGHVDQREINVITNYLYKLMNYNELDILWINDLIKKALEKNYPLETLCAEFNTKFNYESKLMLLELVYAIAFADGKYSASEKLLVQQIIDLLSIQATDNNRLKSFYKDEISAEHHYSVLGIKEGASKDEIKKAYKNACKKHHPDKVHHLGQEFQKIAEEKMRQINESYTYLMSLS
jgi:DnaJ like chaperone protein